MLVAELTQDYYFALAWSVSILGFGSCVGTVTMGWLCTKFRPKYLLTCLYFGRAIILAIFIWVPASMATIFVFSVIFGVSLLHPSLFQSESTDLLMLCTFGLLENSFCGFQQSQ